MHQRFFALRAHGDVAKFEYEDGIVRSAASGLLTEESGIDHVVADVATETALHGASEFAKSSWDASLLISSATPDEPGIAEVPDLVADVAMVTESWPARVLTAGGLDSTWHGTTVPATKTSFVFRRAAGIDAASFEEWIQNELVDTVNNVGTRGSRAILTRDDGDFDDRAIVSMWFAQGDDLYNATATEIFSPFAGSSLIDADSLQLFTSVEHRLDPNPNAWSMPTGPLMPVRETPDDN